MPRHLIFRHNIFSFYRTALVFRLQPHSNALPALGRDEFYASVFKGAADGG